MPLKGAVRGKQAPKTQCLAEQCHGESLEAVRREAACGNVETPSGIQVPEESLQLSVTDHSMT
jgi:hypothetical protein